jgi:phenylpyruvate tautomerase PptA (4-oxalocrotonate tautomerase family)
MPFVRVSLPADLTDTQAAAIGRAVHDALVDVFDVPPQDRFQVLTRHAPHELVCTPEYLGIAHGARVAFVQVTCNEGRSLEKKKALYARLAATLEAAGGIAPADVIVSLVEVKKENWSFGHGLAQYAA